MAGDTFRAAAAEQLAGWAERSRAEMAAATSPKQRPDALMYSAIDRVRMLAGVYIQSALQGTITQPTGARRCVIVALLSGFLQEML